MHLASRLYHLQRLLHFYRNAQTVYDLHSPFAFQFAQAVLEDRRHYYCFSEIETLRQHLLRNRQVLTLEDLGAGSQIESTQQRRVSSIARYSASTPLFCRWLFRMVQFVQPQTILEMGTSLGLSTLYLKAAARESQFITLEGAAPLHQLACKHFHQRKYGPIDARLGPFDQQLIPALNDLKKLDLAFIDGNHTKTATLHYFQECLKYTHPASVLIFDDIHWSTEMEAAWQQIQAHPSVRLTVDLYFAGVVFFRKELQTNAHYQLVPRHWKPWHLGFSGGNV